MTRPEVEACLGLIKASYPRFQISDETVSAYALLLNDVPSTAGVPAVAKCIQQSKWPPTIAEIRDAAYRIAQDQHEQRVHAQRIEEDHQLEPRHITREEWNELKAKWREIGLLQQEAS